MKKLLLIAVIAICSCQIISAQNYAKIDAELQLEMLFSERNDMIPINIILNQQYDPMAMHMKSSAFPTKAAKRSFVVSELQRFSEETQSDLMNRLYELPVQEIQSFWIANFINCQALVDAIEELSLHPDVLLIELDKLERKIPEKETPSLTPADPTREIVANVLKVKADQVWALGYEGEDVLVAVIDTGVNYDHNDLKTHLWTHTNYPYHGWNWVSNNNNPKDDNGHGTHCAGTVAGDGTSGSKTGVAPKATIMALKVLNAQGSGYSSHTNLAIQFAVQHGADILSLSLGSDGSGGVYSDRVVMVNALAAGVIACVAAGNVGDQQYAYPIPKNVGSPGNCPPPWLHPDQTTTGGTSAVVCVGATDNNDNLAGFSSRGPVTWQNVNTFNDYPYNPGMGLIRPDVCAPGVNIKSCSYNNNSGYIQYGWSGTSMSTPCVAGVMALMLSKNPYLDPEDICEIIETTALRLPNSSSPKNNNYGSGRVDALAAINATQIHVEDIVFEGFILNDADGNNDGKLNPGETVKLTFTLKNVSNDPINNVKLIFKTTDGLITIINNTADFGNFAPNETKTVEDAFTIKLSESAPKEHVVGCNIEAKFGDITRKSKIQLMVYDFTIELLQSRIPNNAEIGPGDTSDVWIYLKNTGNGAAYNVTAEVISTSPYLIINEGTAYYGHLYPKQYKYRVFNITIAPETPSSTTFLPYTMIITEASGRKTTISNYIRFKNSGNPPAPCNSIQDLTVEINAPNAVLTWTAPSGSAPEKYLIYFNDKFLAETTATTYTQTNISGGLFRYCVEALYSDGCTSDVACVDKSLPCDVTVQLALTLDGNNAQLSWLPVMDDLKFKVYRDSEFLAEVQGNSYTDTDLELPKIYCYTVSALCAGNIESDPSNVECTGTGINELQNIVKIYPNPANNTLYIEGEGLKTILIHNMLGQTIETIETSGKTITTINTSTYQPALYLIEIVLENGKTMNSRVVITR